MKDKLNKAKHYLDQRRINRARPGCTHKYERFNPALLWDNHVRVTVTRLGSGIYAEF